MKTKNNVQKAITKSLAVIISLVLISITVNAQDFWKSILTNNSFNQIAMVMVVSAETSPVADNVPSNTAETDAKVFAMEYEESLEVENWMMDETIFFTRCNYETEVENSLEIEDWMTNENLFTGLNTYLETEAEPGLEVEDWMHDANYFGVELPTIEIEKEDALELESWMTDTNVWEM